MSSFHAARSLTRAAAIGIALVASLAACGRTSTSVVESTPAVIVTFDDGSPYDASVLPEPYAKPTTPLSTIEGEPFTMSKDAKRDIMILYVGYTHCPDVCPSTTADIAIAKRRLSAAEQARIDVVFLTSDPARDTPERLRQWLDAFDSTFIGLTGPFPAVQAASTAVGIPIKPPVTEPDGTIIVEHGAEILIFGPDDKAHLVLSSGFTPDVLEHDLRLLLDGTPY